MGLDVEGTLQFFTRESFWAMAYIYSDGLISFCNLVEIKIMCLRLFKSQKKEYSKDINYGLNTFKRGYGCIMRIVN